VSGRVTALDVAQRAAMDPHARDWADRALCTDPVDWPRWEAGARACHQYGGVRWPSVVVRTASPLALARALFLARVREVPGDENRALVGLVRQVTQSRVNRVITRLFDRRIPALVQRAVHDPVAAAVCQGAVVQAVDEALYAGPLSDDPAGVQESARAAAAKLTGSIRTGLAKRRVPPEWRSWTLHLGGQWEAAWCAYATFLGAAYGDAGARGWRRRIERFTDAQDAGWWWPHLDFVVISDRPQVVHREQTAATPGRLHCATGPAVVWRDGWRLYFWHGTRVPPWVIERPSVVAIQAEPNVEVRRCAIEAMGWDSYVAGARLRLVDRAADPGNPGCELYLYDLPQAVWGAPTRVLLATNGSPERDGARRRYGLPVPADLGTAVHAAAWTYGLTGEQYARLARRT
jgi:hypothetical protein